MQQTKNSSDVTWSNVSDFGIHIEAGLNPQQKNHILLHGKFKLPCGQNGVPDDGTKIFKHIVLVATRSGNYQSLTPYRDVIVFEDDVQDNGDSCSGFFNMNVMDHIQFNGEGDYYLLCSVGTYVSNIVKVSVD